MFYLILILAACVLLPLAYFFLRFPLTPSWHRGIEYYTNFIFVYERDFTSYALSAIFAFFKS